MSIFDATLHAAHCEDSVEGMKAKLGDSQVLAAAQNNRGLLALDGTVATPEQHKDLVAFRNIGKEYHEAYIKYYILRDPSARVPLRLRCLLTFWAQKRSQRKINLKERVQKLISRCIRQQLAWSAQTQCVEQHMGEQYLELPHAICTPRKACSSLILAH